MKSNKQRRSEIKAARLKRAKRENHKFDTTKYPVPEFAVLADQAKHVTVGTIDLIGLPVYYLDKPFNCEVCGVSEVWTAKQQKWWYEVAQGAVETTAVKCRACRMQTRRAKEHQKEHMKKMADKIPHPNDSFFKK